MLKLFSLRLPKTTTLFSTQSILFPSSSSHFALSLKYTPATSTSRYLSSYTPTLVHKNPNFDMDIVRKMSSPTLVTHPSRPMSSQSRPSSASSKQVLAQNESAKIIFKLSALLLLISTIISFSFTRYCSEHGAGNNTTYYIAMSSSIVASLLTIVLYKTFHESETSLNRRLDRLYQKQNRRRSMSTKLLPFSQQQALDEGSPAPSPISAEEPVHKVKIWADGAWDLCHFAHFNAFRQAKALGDILYVGLNPDAEILKYKGPPVYTEAERKIIIEACKWVDVVVENVPYVMDAEYLEKTVFGEFGMDYCVHGDDPCLTPDGQDVYAAAKAMNRYRTIKRTHGISTTEITSRMLSISKSHLYQVRIPNDDESDESDETDDEDNEDSEHPAEVQFRESSKDLQNFISQHAPLVEKGVNPQSFQRITSFIPTTRRFWQFLGSSYRKAGKDDLVIYCPGTWDCFNHSHIEFLKKVREDCESSLKAKGLTNNIYLIVGLYDDNIANRLHGNNFPILNLYERVMSVLSCKYVDDAVIGCPYKLDKDFVLNFGVKYIYTGTLSDTVTLNPTFVDDYDPHEYPKSLRIYKEITSPVNCTMKDIIQRIAAQQASFEAKFAKKAKSEQAYIDAKEEFVEEL